MASSNMSRNVSSNRDHSAGTWRPPLPRPDNGDNVRPVPLWEREFCRSAYKIPWETFCENKRFIELYKNVMDWDDSGALKNFMDAKERFRAKYHGEPYEDPVLDPDMYIDEVNHQCKVDPELIDGLDNIAGLDLVTEVCWWGGMGNGNLIPPGRGEPYPNLVPTGWGESAANVTPPHCSPDNTNNNSFHGGGPSSNQQQQQGVHPGQTPSGTGMNLIGGGRIWNSGTRRGGAMRWNGGGGGGGNGGARHWNGGGGGGRIRSGGVGGGDSNWKGGGRGNQRNQDEVQHQQRDRGGTQRNRNQNQNEVQHQTRSGGRQQQQQGQTQRVRKEWRPVQHNTAPKNDPAA